MWSDDFGYGAIALTLCACSTFLTVLTLVWTCWSIYRLDRVVSLLAVGSRHGGNTLAFTEDPTQR